MAQRHVVANMNENCLAFDHRKVETGKMDLLHRPIATRPNSMGKSHTGLHKMFPPHGCVVNAYVHIS